MQTKNIKVGEEYAISLAGRAWDYRYMRKAVILAVKQKDGYRDNGVKVEWLESNTTYPVTKKGESSKVDPASVAKPWKEHQEEAEVACLQEAESVRKSKADMQWGQDIEKKLHSLGLEGVNVNMRGSEPIVTISERHTGAISLLIDLLGGTMPVHPDHTETSTDVNSLFEESSTGDINSDEHDDFFAN